jgi:hypothetical protein
MKKILCVSILSLAAFTANAQDTAKKPSPDEMRTMMESSMGMMVPMMGKMAEISIEVQLNAAEKPDTARRVAVFKKNLYDALLQQGFSKDQAFTIMLNTPLPAPGGGVK